MSPSLRRVLAIALAPLALLALAGCAPIVPMVAAPDAQNPECAEVIVRLPDAIEDAAKQGSGNEPVGVWLKRETDAQGTGAWGNPAAILLRCGVAVPGPTTQQCVTLKGIDWLRDDSGAPNYVFTTFGRDPAIEVIVDGERASGTNALVDLSNAVGSIPATGACTNPDDVLGVPEPTPSP
ncbi:hypothetical protein GCM10022239_27130 [Leifsonia bigeumensis]|uniref:DUF3515 domain-containing protein n=1 Tax=Leifsonella bigeumensis TaxID=433643 RepID=A0ABP7FXP0_9MICO